MFGADALSRLLTKKFAEGGHARLARNLSDIGRRLHPETGDALLHEIFQQIPVITGDLDDEAVWPKGFFLGVASHGFGGMPQHVRRK